MGKYTFIWEHSANEVYVTGTFDDWRKTVKLDQEDGIFKKTVELPKEHIQYKFVVNGNWCTNDSARKEDDGHGIINNVLLPEDIVDEEPAKPSESKPIDSTTDVAFNKQEPAAAEQSQPAATAGTENAKPEATSSAPSGQLAPETPGKNLRKDSDISPKGTPGSQSIASGADDKKKNKRRSFFGKIKDKLTSKDKN